MGNSLYLFNDAVFLPESELMTLDQFFAFQNLFQLGQQYFERTGRKLIGLYDADLWTFFVGFDSMAIWSTSV